MWKKWKNGSARCRAAFAYFLVVVPMGLMNRVAHSSLPQRGQGPVVHEVSIHIHLIGQWGNLPASGTEDDIASVGACTLFAGGH